MNTITLVTAITVAVLGSSALTALINNLFARSKNKSEVKVGHADVEKKEAEAESMLATAYGSLFKDFKQQIADLKKEVYFVKKDHTECTNTNKELLKRIELLEAKN